MDPVAALICAQIAETATAGLLLQHLALGGAVIGAIVAVAILLLLAVAKAAGQKPRIDQDDKKALPDADVAKADEAGDKPMSLKEIKAARAAKHGLKSKDALLEARKARKGKSRADAEDVEAQLKRGDGDEDSDAQESTGPPGLDLAMLAPPSSRMSTKKKPKPLAKVSLAKAPLGGLVGKVEDKTAEADDAAETSTPPAEDSQLDVSDTADDSDVADVEADDVDHKADDGDAAKPAAAIDKPTQKTLKEGLAKTRSSGFVGRLKGLFSKKKTLDAELVGELEEVLFTADIGVKTSQQLLAAVARQLAENGSTDTDAVWNFLREETTRILRQTERPLRIGKERPYVILVIGVNGVGKTTTIGKLASKYTDQGHKVQLIAGDTFRAAAIDQLKIWGERTDCEVFSGDAGNDPSSVVFDGLKKAITDNVDVVLVDTAGRLHTKVNLLAELKKVCRVTGKALEGAPHSTLLVLDANTGQNAINQAEMFGKEIGVTGIALTKLDGTAKGGVVIGISDELGLPIQFIGIGEQVEDLREFSAEDFVDAMF